MIRCYYTRATLDTVAKAGRRRAIGCGGILLGIPILLLMGATIRDPRFLFDHLQILLACFFWFGILFFFHYKIRNIEKTTLQHAGDEIILDDDEIRLVKMDGTQFALPRNGLRVQGGYYAAGNVVYSIWNPNISKDKIVLTTNMENAKELVETIRPGAWDAGE
ncbi:MAG: hypothetical protein FWC50_08965 [Planctomycetaceae bacterium]|nr:hypothetical protein [Planctomycetaceae bacterium]